MIEAYRRLFQPIRIGKLEIHNRIAMAPMGVGSLMTEEGGFSQRAIDYYVERARGGTGLIITGISKIENDIEKFKQNSPPCVTKNPHHFIATASELTENVHAYGTKIFIQLTAGFGRSAFPSKVLAVPAIAPSAIPNYWEPGVICRELATDEVERLVQRFSDAARLVAYAGFDGIEIHAVHEGYLLDQFTITLFNKRTDKYGGSLEGRLRLPIEILQVIKNAVGKDFPVILRFGVKSYIKDWGQGGLPGEEFKEMGRDTEEGLEIAKILESAGYDALDADAGSYDAWYWAHPPLYQEHGCYLPLTEKLKKAVRGPVMVAGRMELPELAEKALLDGKADMIVLGRGLLADPYWPKKVMEGKTQKIRPCIGCHDGCFQRLLRSSSVSCTVNPACGREANFAIQKSSKVKSVMVIGGGIAGMEAARVAAIRGHKVDLYEKSDRLGGHLIAASVPSFKKDVSRLLEWYKAEIDGHKVRINLGIQVTPEMITGANPDAIIIATGSQPVLPNVPGIEKGQVLTAEALLLDVDKGGNSVVIIGGGLIGCETALWLAQQDKKVTVVEILDDILSGGIAVPHANRTMLIDLLKYHKVGILRNTNLLKVTEDGAVVIDRHLQKSTLAADTVAISVGFESDQELYRSIRGHRSNVYVVGDAQQARRITHAIWDSYEVARNI